MDQSRRQATSLGRQAWHPRTVHLPVGALVAGWVGLAARLVWPSPRWRDVVTFCLALGLATAVLAAATGFLELARLGSHLAGTPADRVVIVHLSLMLSAATVYGLALWPHLADRPGIAFGVGSVALVGLGAGGHLGGNLVYRHGIGTAHEPNEPNEAHGPD